MGWRRMIGERVEIKVQWDTVNGIISSRVPLRAYLTIASPVKCRLVSITVRQSSVVIISLPQISSQSHTP